MSNCTLEQTNGIVDSINEFFITYAPNKNNFNLKELEIFISGERGMKGFTLRNYLDNPKIKKSAEENFKLYLLSEVSDVLSDTKDRNKFKFTKSNVVKEFSSDKIVDLFHTLPVARNYFEGTTKAKIIKEILIGDAAKPTYVFNDEEIATNFDNLKNELFREIQSFLIDQNKLQKKKDEIQDLFKNGYVQDYNNYRAVMNLLSEHFFSGNINLITSYSGKKIPNLTKDLSTNQAEYDAYNAGVLLTNFDSVLNEYFSGIIDTNFLYFNTLQSTAGKDKKYKMLIEGIKTLYFKGDSHDDESSEKSESKLTHILISSIPAFDKRGKKTTNYMETKDFYLFAAQLANFELLHGNKLRNDKNSDFDYFNNDSKKRLDWYIKNIESAMENEPDSISELREHFQLSYHTILSLKNFLTSKDYNIAVKEKNSEGSVVNMLTQVINNNFGASYYKYGSDGKYTLQEMYKQDFNNIQTQNTTFNKLLANSAKTEFFDISESPEKEKYESLFKDLSDNDNILEIPNKIKIKIGNYIREKTGINLHYIAFNDVIKGLLSYKKEWEKITVKDFKTQLGVLMDALLSDVKSKDFQEKIASQKLNKETRGDVTVGEYLPETLKNLLYAYIRDSYLLNFVVKPVMNVELTSGEKLPTFKTANLTYKDTELFELQRQFEKQNPEGLYKSMLIGNTPVILGTGTRLEAINDDWNKTGFKFSVAESYVSDLQFDFLENLVKKRQSGTIGQKQFSIILGNYSDKNSVHTKVINGDHMYNGSTVISKSIDEITELVRSQGRNFYFDALLNVFKDYKNLFDSLGIKNNIELTESDFDNNIEEINTLLDKFSILELIKQYTQKGHNMSKLNIMNELHYSLYGEKTRLNQTLVDNFKIFNDPDNLFKEFVKRSEQSFIDKFNEYVKPADNSLGLIFGKDKNKLKEYLSALNLDQKKDFGEDPVDGLLVQGKLNPMVRKWQWLNALYRNEYIFMTAKGEFMHPHKSDVGLRTVPGKEASQEEIDSFWNSYSAETSARLVTMAKRNVIYTATIESPVRNSKLGIPDKINLAAIQDTVAPVFNINGLIKPNQEVHDGATFIDATYSMMIDNSYPGKGYTGTKKQFGTLITPHGVTIKKDAETVLTNDRILNSKKSLISLLNKKEQMLSMDTTGNTVNFEKNDLNYFYNKSGKLYKIKSLKIEGDNYVIRLAKNVEGKWVTISMPVKGKFNNLFQLWKLFGGQYSTDENGNFNEGSNELLYEVITTADSAGNYSLKNKIIHVVSNASALKAGAVNLNTNDAWKNNEKLAYTSYDSRFMGPQLDASHEADNSKIKEVTQVISALAQNGNTAHLAKEAYEDIARVIEKAAQPYKKYFQKIVGPNGETSNDPENLKQLYLDLSEKFVKAVERSKGENIAKTLVHAFDKDTRIPFSNMNFFVHFVRDIISRMNNEFITRYYSGLGAVLIPSHGIFQLYDVPIKDELGNTIGYKTATQADLTKEALSNWSGEDLDNDVIIENHINKLLPNEDTTWDKIELGDTVLIDVVSKDGIPVKEKITLSSPDLYYKHKPLNSNNPVIKVLNVPRDLKPSSSTFKVNGLTKNFFDLDSVRILFGLSFGTLSERDQKILQNFINRFSIDPTDSEKIKYYLIKWTQRNLQLLDNKKIMLDRVDENTNFADYFGTDELTKDIFFDVKNEYESKVLDVSDFKFNAAELVVGDIYSTKFQRQGDDSIYEITNKGPKYFADLIEKHFEYDDTVAEAKLIVNDLDKPVYIKFVSELEGVDKTVNLVAERSDDGSYVYSRHNQAGQRIYTLPNNENYRVVNKDGNEVILVKAAVKSIIGDKEIWNKVPGFEYNLSELIHSFQGKITSFVPLMNGELGNTLKTLYTDKDGKEKSGILNLNNSIIREFSKFSGFIRVDGDILSNKWLEENKANIIEQLSTKMFASWQKSHEFISARIPSQSMQSFMEMKNVGYMKGKSNDAYVSVWQIWLQGSDFDIDKSYLLGSGFNNNGQFDLWTSVSNYSSLEQLNVLEKFPIPTGNKAIIVSDPSMGVDLSQEIAEFNALTSAKDFLNKEFSAAALKVINRALRKLKNNTLVYSGNPTDFESLVDIINEHNTFKDHLKRNDAVKNSVISRMKATISSPSNQIIANIPVDVKSLQKSADNVLKNSNRPKVILSPYDILSYYKQQRDAAVGKDDVGIMANGLKVTFALTSYYNNFFENELERKIGEQIIPDETALASLRTSSKIFKKSFTFYKPNGEVVTKNIGTISDIQISRSQKDLLNKAIGETDYYKSDAAITLSGLTSAATDNAKELLMAKVNANTDLASSLVYLVTLGFTADEAFEVMTMDVIYDIVDQLDSNIFFDKEPPRVDLAISNLSKIYKLKTEDEAKTAINQRKLNNLETFKKIYHGAQEMRFLSNLLAVNQSITANPEEIYKYLSNFEHAIFARELSVFPNIEDIKDVIRSEKSQNSTIRSTIAEKWDNVIKQITANNQKFDAVKDAEYIKSVIRNASNIKNVYVVDEFGEEKIETTSLVGGEFNFNYYIDERNQSYRDATTQYYDLIKNTFNIFDIINNVPHFKEMVNGLILSHNILSNSSAKYNFVFSTLKRIAKKNADMNTGLTTFMGNKNFPILIGNAEVSKAFLGVDIMLKDLWFKSEQTNDLVFNVQKLMKLADVKEFTLYTSDDAMKYGINESKAYQKIVKVDDGNEDRISLTSNYGIANFKRLVEQILLPILQQNEGNPLTDYLKVESGRNLFGLMGNSITSTFSLGELNNPVSIERFQQLIMAFNNLDINPKTAGQITNINGKPMQWRDLLYVYNLIVNNDKYGNKRLTPLFQDYIKERNSLGYKYVTFSSLLDSKNLKLFDIEKRLALEQEYFSEDKDTKEKAINKVKQEWINDIMFYAFNKFGNVNIGAGNQIDVVNPDFLVVTSLTESELTKRRYKEFYDLMRLLRSKGLIIKFQC